MGQAEAAVEGPQAEPQATPAHDDGATPMSELPDAGALHVDAEDRLPSLPAELRKPPPGEPSAELQRKIENWIRIQETQGRTVYEEIQKSRHAESGLRLSVEQNRAPCGCQPRASPGTAPCSSAARLVQHPHCPHRLSPRRGYRNPEFFRKMIEHYDIKQYGSCLPAEVLRWLGSGLVLDVNAERALTARTPPADP